MADNEELYNAIKAAAYKELESSIRLTEWLNSRYPDREKLCREIADPGRYKELVLQWYREELLRRCRDVADEFPNNRTTAYKVCKSMARDFAEMDKDETDRLRDECLISVREAERETKELIAEAVRSELESRIRLADWIRMRYPEPSEEVVNPDKYRRLVKAWYREELLDRCKMIAEKYGNKVMGKKDVYEYCKSLAATIADRDKLEADALREEYRRELEAKVTILPEEIREAALAEVQAKLAPFEDIDKYIEEKYGADPCWLIATHPPGWAGSVYNQWKKDVMEACRAMGKLYGREAYNECIDRASDMADAAKSRLKELYDMCRPRRRTLVARILGW